MKIASDMFIKTVSDVPKGLYRFIEGLIGETVFQKCLPINKAVKRGKYVVVQEDIATSDLAFMEEGDMRYISMFYNWGCFDDNAYKSANAVYLCEWPEDEVRTIPIEAGETPARGKRVRAIATIANEANRKKISKVMHK